MIKYKSMQLEMGSGRVDQMLLRVFEVANMSQRTNQCLSIEVMGIILRVFDIESRKAGVERFKFKILVLRLSE